MFRLLVLAGSLLLISWWTQTWVIATFLLVVAGVSYSLIIALKWVGQRANPVWVGATLVLSLFSLVPLANAVGVVGTLTGNSADNVGQLPWLLGMPYLVLQIAAAGREIIVEDHPVPSFLDYALLLLFFPKFLSGPLEHLSVIKDFRNIRWPDGETLEQGFGFVLLGLFMKFAIGNQLVPLIDVNMTVPPGLLLSVAAFEFRVYFDLAGYSFIALGTARMLGINLTCNFRHPFFSPNVCEFWQRWHISLGRWFFSNVFKPVKARLKQYALLASLFPLVIFILSAAWHGMHVNFLLWGSFHGLCFVAYTRIFRRFHFSRAIGLLGMIGVLWCGRLLFMDSDTQRLFLKFSNLFDPAAWSYGLKAFSGEFSSLSHWKSSLVAVFSIPLFLVGEGLSLRFYPDRPYQFFMDRRVQLVMLFCLLVLTKNLPAGFVYARQ